MCEGKQGYHMRWVAEGGTDWQGWAVGVGGSVGVAGRGRGRAYVGVCSLHDGYRVWAV